MRKRMRKLLAWLTVTVVLAMLVTSVKAEAAAGDREAGSGIATGRRQYRPVQVEGVEGATGVAAYRSSFAVLFGHGGAARCVDGACREVPGVAGATHLALSESHLLVVTARGTVQTLQFGAPAVLHEMVDVRSAALAGDSLLAVTVDGRAWEVSLESGTTLALEGLNALTQLERVGSTRLALRADGSVWASPSGGTGFAQVKELADVISLHSGPADTALAVLADGGVAAIAITESGVKSVAQVAGLTGVLSAAAASTHGVALRADGTVWTVFFDGSAPEQVTGMENVVAVAAGDASDYAVKADGTVWTWAAPRQAGVVPGLRNVKAVAAAGETYAALRADGTLALIRFNDKGEARVWGDPHVDEVRAVDAAPGYVVVARGDGTVSTIAIDETGVHVAGRVEGLSGVVDVSAAESHFVARTARGSLFLVPMAGGSPGRPVAVAGDNTPVIKGSALWNGAVALRADGSVVTVGTDGTTQAAKTGRVRTLIKATPLIAFVSGGSFTPADMDADGALRVWGDPHVMESGIIAGDGAADRLLLVDGSGRLWTFAVREGGRTVGAGQVVEIVCRAVAVGDGWNLVLLADGTVGYF